MNRLGTVILLIGVTTTALADDGPKPFEFFPGKKLFPQQTADALTHHISISKNVRNRDWIGTIGGSLPLIQANFQDVSAQASVGVSTFNRLVKPPGITVYTVDFKVDIPADIRYRDWAFRFGLGHLSCHFADDAIELYGKRSIQYVKDYVVMGAARDISEIRGHVYTIAQLNYHIKPIENKHWNLQWGAEFGNVAITDLLHLYGAIDIKVKQEVGWGSTRSFEAGIRVAPSGDYALRIAYIARRGYEERGQFFNQQESVDLVSLHIDF